MKDKQEEKLKQEKQIIASNIHLMENYLEVKRKLTWKTAMKKSVEQLEKMYYNLIPLYQFKTKLNYINFELAKEFDMKDYLTGDDEYDKKVDERRLQLENEEGYMYLGLFWQVIFTIDIHKESQETITSEKPECVKRPYWYVTETEVEDTEYYKSHRKYCSEDITTKQLIEFCEQAYFNGADHTCGAITFKGHLPAVCLHNYDYGHSLSAYVSPLMIDHQLNELYDKYDKDKWKSTEAKDMRNIIGNEIDKVLEIIYNSPDEGWESIPKSVKVSKPMTLQFKSKGRKK